VLTVAAMAVVVAHAEDERPAPPPQDWIARVKDRYLTKERLAQAVVWRVRQELLEHSSAPLTVLREMVEERVVLQESRRLRLHVSTAEVDAKYRAIEKQVRDLTNGAKTLHEVITREWHQTIADFRANLQHELLKEKVAGHQEYLGLVPKDEKAKLAQIEVVIGELIEKSRVEYGLPTALQNEPSKLAPGVVATVNGEPITLQQYGQKLLVRLPRVRIRSIIHEECRSVLTTSWALTVEQMDRVIEREKASWHQYREMSTQEALRSLSYEDYVKMQYRLDIAGLRQDRYFRGLYGLVESMRRAVKPEQIRKEYDDKKDTAYGDRYLVTDVQIMFRQRDDLLGPSAGRTRRDALKLANEILRRAHSGVDFERIAREINEKRDATFFARRLRVRNTDNERHLYQQAKLLQDGTVSRPFETLAEVHVLRREKYIPAPTFAQIEDLIRQRIAFGEANEWLEKQMTDKSLVEIRWPPKDD
jgi:hypothetical protein